MMIESPQSRAAQDAYDRVCREWVAGNFLPEAFDVWYQCPLRALGLWTPFEMILAGRVG
jgi:hypothetical protein